MGGARIARALESRAEPGKGQGLRSRKESHLPFYFPLKEIFPTFGGFPSPRINGLRGRGLFGGALLPPAGRRGTLPPSGTLQPGAVSAFRVLVSVLWLLPWRLASCIPGYWSPRSRGLSGPSPGASASAWSKGLPRRTSQPQLCVCVGGGGRWGPTLGGGWAGRRASIKGMFKQVWSRFARRPRFGGGAEAGWGRLLCRELVAPPPPAAGCLPAPPGSPSSCRTCGRWRCNGPASLAQARGPGRCYL